MTPVERKLNNKVTQLRKRGVTGISFSVANNLSLSDSDYASGGLKHLIAMDKPGVDATLALKD